MMMMIDNNDVFFIIYVVEVLREQRNTPCSVQILEVRCKCSQQKRMKGVEEWKIRKATHEIDPVELINTQRGDMVEYNYISTKTERTFYSVEVKCGRVSLAKTRKGVTANKRYYIPVHDVNCKYLVPSKKRHR